MTLDPVIVIDRSLFRLVFQQIGRGTKYSVSNKISMVKEGWFI